MGAASRRKGRDGERELADAFEARGFHVRGLESGGDWLCVPPMLGLGATLHVEVKRQERLEVMRWVRQAEDDAAPGAVAVVAFRQSREPWRVVLRLEDLLRLVG